ncbi:hypothetical protein VE03_10228 [Pseudogymnoascus sp. 23342-1-I1]|nr:hypothetical protein VE03_10228 [Pseudogymnoascus sp. 23342-1-I1]
MATTASAHSLISTALELKAFLSSIPPSSTLYVDLEGNNLSRHGTVSLITILVHPQGVVRVIDVLVLRDLAFTTTSISGKTLKGVFEDPDMPKCAWDVRNDADALWAHYHVKLAGVTDIQLLENASRASDKKYVHGLDNSVQFDLKLGFKEAKRWSQTKKDIRSLMSANVFATRPIDTKTVQYCINDVIHLPNLHHLYLKRIDRDWLTKAMEESTRRVADAYSPGFDPQSPTKKLGPWGSGAKPTMTLDEMLEESEEKRMEDLERDIFGFGDDLDDYFGEEEEPEDDWFQ